jgi:hypothetical protein
VTIDEVMASIYDALDRPGVSVCRAVDRDGDLEISIDEIVQVVIEADSLCQ